MTTKKVSDPRQEPDSGTSEDLKVDRVFAPRTASAPGVAGAPRRPTGRTIPPLAGDAADAELALRRQLSRLQRQLAEAQRELANKDEELAKEVERRLEVTTAAEALQHEHLELEQRYIELTEYRARTEGLDQRLQDAIAGADELSHQLERERAERGAIQKQLEEQIATFDRSRNLWKEESALMQEHHANELTLAENLRRQAVEAFDAQMTAALERQKEAHEAEMNELRAAHERSLAALRGELEPKVAVARNLSEEIERLTSALNAAKAEHMRDVVERVELHKWEMQQQVETHAAQLATEQRHQSSELARRDEEIAAKTEALAHAERNAMLREEVWEQTVTGLRESQKKLQQELAEAKEKVVQTDASKVALEQRLTMVLAQIDKLNDEMRQMREKLDAAETQARHSALDRQRMVAYLEEGLAMLGAIPPSTDSQPVIVIPPASGVVSGMIKTPPVTGASAPSSPNLPVVSTTTPRSGGNSRGVTITSTPANVPKSVSTEKKP